MSLIMRTARIRVALRQMSDDYELSVNCGGVNEYADFALFPTKKGVVRIILILLSKQKLDSE